MSRIGLRTLDSDVGTTCPINDSAASQREAAAFLLISLAFVCLASCSGATKTVTWDEEVEIAAGQTAWVKREDKFRSSTEPGNPLQSGWVIDSRSVLFEWKGATYQFDTKSTALMMIREIDNTPSIAVIAWNSGCAKPGYSEYRWVRPAWKVQREMSPFFVDAPRNLMGFFSAHPGDIPARLTIEFKRNARFDLPQRGGEEPVLRASRVGKNCQSEGNETRVTLAQKAQLLSQYPLNPSDCLIERPQATASHHG